MQGPSYRLQFALAATLPLCIGIFSWFVHGTINTVNIALLYILVVIVTAVNTGTKPALLSAVVSFLAFNFSFTEPRGTFIVMHRQDLLMIVLFLLIAVIVGQLAANIKEQLERIRLRELMTRTELKFIQSLSSAMSPDEIISVLKQSLRKVPRLEYRLLNCTNNGIDWSEKEHFELAKIRQQIADHLSSGRAQLHTELQGENTVLLFIGDGESTRQVLIVFPCPDTSRDIARILAQQAILALTRIRLSSALKGEIQEKENELLRSSLLSSLSHDFKTPLTTMIGASSTLLELGEGLSAQEHDELLETILTESRRLNSFTEKLLDMARLGRGQFALERTTIALDEIVHAVIKRIRMSHSQSVKVSIPDDLPLISVHTALLEQAIYNVVDNACKFSDGKAPVSINAMRRNNELLIIIEDSGPGIPDAEKQRVLDMFHSADQGDRRVAGSGLGLAICKGMIGAHGGSVSISDSTELGGARVTLCIPLTTE